MNSSCITRYHVQKVNFFTERNSSVKAQESPEYETLQQLWFIYVKISTCDVVKIQNQTYT